METEQKMDSEETTETETTEEQADETLTDEAKLAADALAASEEKPEETVPACVAGELRRRATTAEIEAAELRGQLAVIAAPVVEKSPLELRAQEQGVSVDEVDMDGALYRKQKVFEDKQTAIVAEKTAAERRAATGVESQRQALIDFSAEKMGEGLDLETVLSMGARYLTAGDKLDIYQAGGKSAQVAYKRCRQRIAESGTADATTVSQRFAVHKKAQAELKKKQHSEPEGGKPPKIPSQDEILSAETGAIFGGDGW